MSKEFFSPSEVSEQNKSLLFPTCLLQFTITIRTWVEIWDIKF